MIKRQLFRRWGAGICGVALLASLTGALAAPAETVHAQLWLGYHIFAGGEGQGVIFLDEQGRQVRPISYNGTVYVPLRTAGEWMGGQVAWEQETQTASITTGGEPRYWRYRDEPDSSEAESEQFTYDLENGIDITLRPDLTIKVDGEVKSFQNVKGEPVYPVVFRDVTYLPVRSIGELLGQKVLWVPNIWPSDGPLDWDYEYLLTEPPLEQLEVIYIYDQPTEAQMGAVQHYIDEANRIYLELVESIQAFLTSEPLNQEETAEALEQICGYAEKIRQMPSPGVPFFEEQVDWLNLAMDALDVFRMDYDITQVRDGALDFEQLVENNRLGNSAMNTLRNMRIALPRMQALLDQVRANGGV